MSMSHQPLTAAPHGSRLMSQTQGSAHDAARILTTERAHTLGLSIQADGAFDTSRWGFRYNTLGPLIQASGAFDTRIDHGNLAKNGVIATVAGKSEFHQSVLQSVLQSISQHVFRFSRADKRTLPCPVVRSRRRRHEFERTWGQGDQPGPARRLQLEWEYGWAYMITPPEYARWPGLATPPLSRSRATPWIDFGWQA